MVSFKNLLRNTDERAEAVDSGKVLQRRRDSRLQKAVVDNNPVGVIEALRAAADPNFMASVKKNDAPGGFEKTSVLELATRYGYLGCARELILGDADIRRPFTDGSGILHHMVQLTYQEDAYELIAMLRGRGLDFAGDAGPDVRLRTVLFPLAGSLVGQELLREALLFGTDASLPNNQGVLAEDFPDRKRYEANMNMIRLHRLAPMLPQEIDNITRDDLLATNEHGLCALDHWDTWMRCDEIQQSLHERGEEMLTGEDLIQPVAGMRYHGAEATRVQLMLQTVPAMVETMFAPTLWENETPANLKAMMRQLPQDIQEDVPYHAALLAVSRNRAQLARSERSVGG